MEREIVIRFRLSDVLKGLLASPVVVLAVYFLLTLPWDAEAAPGWVQAIGSIGAIAAALAVAELGHRRERERNARERLLSEVQLTFVAERALAAAADAVEEVCAAIARAKYSPDDFSVIGAGLDNARQFGVVIRELMLRDIPHSLVRSLVEASADLAFVISLVSKWKDSFDIPPAEPFQLRKKASAIRARRLKVEEEYRRLAGQAGVDIYLPAS